MAKKKKVSNIEKIAEWNIDLQELIIDVERQYELHSSKEIYDFLTTLEIAQKCII